MECVGSDRGKRGSGDHLRLGLERRASVWPAESQRLASRDAELLSAEILSDGAALRRAADLRAAAGEARPLPFRSGAEYRRLRRAFLSLPERQGQLRLSGGYVFRCDGRRHRRAPDRRPRFPWPICQDQHRISVRGRREFNHIPGLSRGGGAIRRLFLYVPASPACRETKLPIGFCRAIPPKMPCRYPFSARPSLEVV